MQKRLCFFDADQVILKNPKAVNQIDGLIIKLKALKILIRNNICDTTLGDVQRDPIIALARVFMYNMDMKRKYRLSCLSLFLQ